MAINNRYDFVMFFDVENGNPNGDPDAGNSPRVDPETGYGYTTDVSIKAKIRNYVDITKEGEAGYNILIKPDRSLNSRFTEAYKELGLETGRGTKKTPVDEVIKARDYMCKNYFDVRTFGAVMSTGDDPCGIVRGPVQIGFAKSVSPVSVQDISITRKAKTTDERLEDGETEMGRKQFIPYALYRAEGHISAALAQKITGFSDDDVDLLWEAIENMFEHDHSAARGEMRLRKLYIFKHDNVLGRCPAYVLFDKIGVRQKGSVAVPRNFSDYEFLINGDMPEGVTFIDKV